MHKHMTGKLFFAFETGVTQDERFLLSGQQRELLTTTECTD